jgi:hypothetical protein
LSVPYRPSTDEHDPRPLPEGDHVAGAIADIFDALIATLEDSCRASVARY